ncbi:hypothetical protein HIM_10763 [Hirsutella minnesotensis 3608]|uniref:Uncharacterized protein n=1 Tax=Hirsutella minnesotensis 3608 TaxID=1043627 RepID=A0A0F7ZJQ3_9HYPO|nr:hypothetical protein HIM_10763 [Hirsutella minnesotensis 3608]
MLRNILTTVYKECKRPTFVPIPNRLLYPNNKANAINPPATTAVTALQILMFAPKSLKDGVPNLGQDDYEKRFPTPPDFGNGEEGINCEGAVHIGPYGLEDLNRAVLLLQLACTRRERPGIVSKRTAPEKSKSVPAHIYHDPSVNPDNFRAEDATTLSNIMNQRSLRLESAMENMRAIAAELPPSERLEGADAMETHTEICTGPGALPHILHHVCANLGLCKDDTANLLICAHKECQHALSVRESRVTTHLRDKHGIPDEARKGLTSFLKALPRPALREPDDVAPLADGSPEHGLLRVYNGFACRKCPYRTISLQYMRRHFSDSASRHCPAYGTAHNRRATDALFEYVFLQAWTAGPARKYWIIEREGNLVRPAHIRGVQEHLQSVHEREQGRDVGLIVSQEAAAPGNHRLTFAEQRPWIERTGWDEMYRDRCHRHVLPALIELPTCSRRGDHMLGPQGVCGLQEDLISSFRDERRIGAILSLVDKLMDRCEETARKTSRSILCWLRSTRALSPYSKPFTLVRQHASTVKYRTLLKKCIAMIFRAYRMTPDVRQRATGIRLKKKHLAYVESMWHNEALDCLVHREDSLRRDWACRDAKNEEQSDQGDACEQEGSEFAIADSDVDDENDGADGTDDTDGADEEDEEDEEDGDNDSNADCGDGVSMETPFDASCWSSTEEDNSPDDEARLEEEPSDKLLELLLGLCLSLGTQPLVDGQPNSTVLIYFSGILGLKPQSQTFAPARSYTTHLSALIYNLRLLFLENALPLRSYPLLGISRRPRMNQLERLEPIRRRYMIMGSQSPFEELISLRNFGHVMARSDTPPFLLRWSDDGQTVSLGGEVNVSMSKFRRLCDHFIEEAEALCNELLFRWEPPIDLSSVKDDMTNDGNEFSFVSHPRNNLRWAYLELCDKACSSPRGSLYRDKDWSWPAIFRYFRKEEAFRAALLGCLDATGGQKPRCSELLSLYCVNGEFGPRGVYVYNGAMVYVVRHHKAKRNTNREFVVARFLPAQVGHLLYKYLVYIRPFVDMLHREGREGLRTGRTGSPLLFRSEAALGSKPWPTGRLTAVLKKATSEVWGVSINSRQFRQLCIGVTEKHVREIHEAFNRFDDTSEKADRNVVFAWQSGHRPLQRGTTYGLDGAYPNKLQPPLLELYQWASCKWHEFLHLPSYAVHKPVDNQLSQIGAKMVSSGHDAYPQNTAAQAKRRRDEASPARGEHGITKPRKRIRPASIGEAGEDSSHRHDGLPASASGSTGPIATDLAARAPFGTLSGPATTSSLRERRLILEHLDECNDNTEDTLKSRLQYIAREPPWRANANMADRWLPTLLRQRWPTGP